MPISREHKRSRKNELLEMKFKFKEWGILPPTFMTMQVMENISLHTHTRYAKCVYLVTPQCIAVCVYACVK